MPKRQKIELLAQEYDTLPEPVSQDAVLDDLRSIIFHLKCLLSDIDYSSDDQRTYLEERGFCGTCDCSLVNCTCEDADDTDTCTDKTE